MTLQAILRTVVYQLQLVTLVALNGQLIRVINMSDKNYQLLKSAQQQLQSSLNYLSGSDSDCLERILGTKHYTKGMHDTYLGPEIAEMLKATVEYKTKLLSILETRNEQLIEKLEAVETLLEQSV